MLLPDVLSIESVKGNVQSTESDADIIDTVALVNNKKSIERVMRRDTNYNKESRHALQEFLTSHEAFQDGMVEVHDDQHAMEDQMLSLITEFLGHCCWGQDEIVAYVQTGDFPVLICLTYQYQLLGL